MAHETEGLQLDSDRLRRGVRAALASQDKGAYLVAELNGRIVGSLLITQEWSDWRDAYFWWIQSVYVEPAFRRRGVYRALHARVLELALARGDVCGIRLYVDRENAIARRAYSSVGMVRSHYEMYEQGLPPGG